MSSSFSLERMNLSTTEAYTDCEYGRVTPSGKDPRGYWSELLPFSFNFLNRVKIFLFIWKSINLDLLEMRLKVGNFACVYERYIFFHLIY